MCGDDEQHGVTDKLEYETVCDLFTIAMCRNVRVSAIIKENNFAPEYNVDRIGKVPHPDYFKLKEIKLVYEDAEEHD